MIGIRQATNGSNNVVFGITASPEEYSTYIQLVTERPQISKSYLCYFGDIYLTNPRLLPAFDIVALFHLGEFIDESTTSPEYGGLSDLGLTRALLANTRPGGNVLIYSESFAHDHAEAVAAELETAKEIAFVGKFEKLVIYRKTWDDAFRGQGRHIDAVERHTAPCPRIASRCNARAGA